MSESIQSASARAAVSKQILVCLVLALLFFFNPFLLTPESARGLSLLHPPSYRATVASAELLKFKNPDNPDASTIADCKEIKRFLLFQPQTSAPRVSAEELLPAGHLLSGNVWFRPPPAA
jgi:hypothetical protein